MLFEQILIKTFILFEWLSKHEKLCYLNELSLKHLTYLNDLKKWIIMLFERIFDKNIYLIWTIFKTWTIMLFEKKY